MMWKSEALLMSTKYFWAEIVIQGKIENISRIKEKRTTLEKT